MPPFNFGKRLQLLPYWWPIPGSLGLILINCLHDKCTKYETTLSNPCACTTNLCIAYFYYISWLLHNVLKIHVPFESLLQRECTLRLFDIGVTWRLNEKKPISCVQLCSLNELQEKFACNPSLGTLVNLVM